MQSREQSSKQQEWNWNEAMMQMGELDRKLLEEFNLSGEANSREAHHSLRLSKCQQLVGMKHTRLFCHLHILLESQSLVFTWIFVRNAAWPQWNHNRVQMIDVLENNFSRLYTLWLECRHLSLLRKICVFPFLTTVLPECINHRHVQVWTLCQCERVRMLKGIAKTTSDQHFAH